MKPVLRPAAYVNSSRSWTSPRCLLPLLILSLMLPLIGCGASYTPPPINVDTVEVERPPAKPPLPEPEPVDLVAVDWAVVETPSGPMIALSEEQFELLAQNLAEILRWIREAAWRLAYYGSP